MLRPEADDAEARDRYPSRLPSGSPERLLARGAPAVWSGPGARGPLEATELARFERDGFLTWPSFFGEPTVASLRDELEAQLASASPGDPHVVLEPDSDHVVRSIFAVHRRSDPFARLARDPRLVAIARQILGGDVYLHQARLNLKPGFDGHPFWWHSDFETWHSEDGMPAMRCVSCVIALSEITEHNGPLLLVPGSHQVFVSCVGETPEDHHTMSLRAQTVGVPSRAAVTQLVSRFGIAAPKGPAGTVILFDCNLMHGSAGNITPSPRPHLFFVYNAVANRLGRPPSGRAPRPEHIATRETFEPLGD